MSWFGHLSGQPPEPPRTPGGTEYPPSPFGNFPINDTYPKVEDPSGVEKDRLVSTKQANRPFLAYKEYRDKQEKEHQAWMERKKEREEKLAKGEAVGPEEPDPTEEREVGCIGLLKFFTILLVITLLAGKFFTGDYLWDYQGKWRSLKAYIPNGDQLITEKQLAQHDGSDSNKPLWLAIDGDVYDVSSNRKTYGPGGSYHGMAGIDAARAFGTGCFKDHRTHDLRGMLDSEMQGVEHWKEFFANHKSYPKVGKVVHPPIDPASPIPEASSALVYLFHSRSPCSTFTYSIAIRRKPLN
ncbi:cytochrome b5 [Punctularia strigosozonata HHB-11173 SS5]|uniref:cytochrome b5 n=1 Tax=Punctularia strigosozonata (strain HHB-11173) TaxID=741275 RepID=UPI0004416FD2|nr:cytochrome b5 [Punctularia strigosozonata HHB-11173 SS5]EIN10814.1 cytochrome b5 [Punctularia strigosozonata HHB-11173 SS5]